MVKPTLRPFWQAARPSPRTTCVLPVPLGPRAMTFSRRSMNSPRASSMVSALLRDGIALKSKLSRLLVAGNFAALMRRSTILRSRSISSSSQSRNRYWTWSLPSAAHCARTRADHDTGGVCRRAGKLGVLVLKGGQLELPEMVLEQHLGRVTHAALPRFTACSVVGSCRRAGDAGMAVMPAVLDGLGGLAARIAASDRPLITRCP